MIKIWEMYSSQIYKTDTAEECGFGKVMASPV